MRQTTTQDSLIVRSQQVKGVKGVLTKIDLFSFIPVPKDNPVSTKRSMIGSLIFIVIAVSYIGQDFYFFATDNPPLVQSYNTNLGFEFFKLPDVAITFMQGEALDQTYDYTSYMSFSMTKQLKDRSVKLSADVDLVFNDPNLQRWISKSTSDFYYRLYSPNQDLKARGLLYSTQNCNYTKITIRRCNFANPEAGCKTEEQIRKKMAQGRIFLFIQDPKDESSSAIQELSSANNFTIANFFLIPRVYKRVTVTFNVIKTQVNPNYFTSWFKENTTRLQLAYITQMTSDVTANAEQKQYQPLQMMGIQFQLSPSVTNIRVSYDNLLDRVGKWGGFCNALFTVLAIFLLKYNRSKFYKKNPRWNNFNNQINSEQNNIVRS